MFYTFIMLAALASPEDDLSAIRSSLETIAWQQQLSVIFRPSTGGGPSTPTLPNYACSKSGTGPLPPCRRFVSIADWRRAYMVAKMAYRRATGASIYASAKAARDQYMAQLEAEEAALGIEY